MASESTKPQSRLDAWADKINERVKNSAVGRFFEIEERNTTFLGEIRAGIVCFLTVAYIIPVNSGILTDSGGSCNPATECLAENYERDGEECKFYDPGYGSCLAEFKQSAIAATCIAAMIGTVLMSMVARMPLAVAPAMGVNAYFTYNVIGYLGTKTVSYEHALAAAFVEGWIFILISVSGVRGRIVELIPKNIMFATAAGIGMFLAFIGLQKSEGLGFVAFDPATLTSLGGCPLEEQGHMYSFYPATAEFLNDCLHAYVGANFSDPSVIAAQAKCQALSSTQFQSTNSLGPASSNYQCFGKQLQSPTLWLGVAGGFIMVVLMMRHVKASILYGILFITFISWIPDHAASYLGAESEIPGGEERKDYFMKGVTVPTVEKSGGMLDFSGLATSDVWIALITFLYLDFLDATSCMFTLARQINDKVPGFVDSRGSWPRQLQTMVVDGVAIVVGSTLGTSPLTVFAESSVGIKEGGTTGITSFMVACGFGLSMFFSPIFASIPPYATGPAIFFVGALMMEHSRHVEWDNPRVALPAFITMIVMPLTYSIAYGVLSGLAFNIALWLAEFFLDSFNSLVFKTEPMRHVLLRTFDSWFVAFNHEQYLIDNLPGYEVADRNKTAFTSRKGDDVSCNTQSSVYTVEDSSSDDKKEPKLGPDAA